VKREDWEKKKKHNKVVERLHTKIRISMARSMGFIGDLITNRELFYPGVSMCMCMKKNKYSKRRTKVKVKETISSLEILWPILVCLAFNGWV